MQSGEYRTDSIAVALIVGSIALGLFCVESRRMDMAGISMKGCMGGRGRVEGYGHKRSRALLHGGYSYILGQSMCSFLSAITHWGCVFPFVAPFSFPFRL